MTFFVHGLTGHDLMPLKNVLKQPVVEKMAAIEAQHVIDESRHQNGTGQYSQQHVAQVYQSVKQIPQIQGVVRAEQIMSTHVVSLCPEEDVDMALSQLRTRPFRHLPIVTSAGMLVGIISDRDILHHLSGITEDFQAQARQSRDEWLIRLMKTPVLTASEDTDVRYIARLFVEQRVGALPVVTNGEIRGIITRSDILDAVMRHYVFELWV